MGSLEMRAVFSISPRLMRLLWDHVMLRLLLNISTFDEADDDGIFSTTASFPFDGSKLLFSAAFSDLSVGAAGLNKWSGNTSGFNGEIPVAENPVKALLMVAAFP